MAHRRRRANHGERTRVSTVARELVARRIPEAQVRLARLRRAWPHAATSRIAAQAWPAAISKDELVVDVHDSQWLHELTYLRADLLERVREACPDAGICAIRLRLAKLPGRREGEDAPEEDSPRTFHRVLPPEPSEETMRAIDSVHDQELRHAVASARVALSRDPGHTR
jgi:predicted nucleic acid-binding Zn ribbon protein